MRITQEADYAVRIIDCIARSGGRLDAHSVSEKTGVTLRFTLKILRKLVKSKIVVSFKGVQGGYELAKEPEQINLKQVIEAVDGPIVINKCLSGGLDCTKSEYGSECYYHNIFAEVSREIQKKLESITFKSSHTIGK